MKYSPALGYKMVSLNFLEFLGVAPGSSHSTWKALLVIAVISNLFGLSASGTAVKSGGLGTPETVNSSNRSGSQLSNIINDEMQPKIEKIYRRIIKI